MASGPTSITLFDVPLEPQLDPADPRLYQADGVTPLRHWSTGTVSSVFFNRAPRWMQGEVDSGVLVSGRDIPEPAPVGGNVAGGRRWTIVDVEKAAFAMFRSEAKPSFDAATLLRTLEVVYAVARLQGLMPSQ